jgi:ApaG protein
MIFAEITHDIRVIVKPVFIEQESDLVTGRYVFAYYITIENMSLEPVQLLRRQWYINDSNGETHEVHGEGVVGKQPMIQPGESHSYNSYCVLKSFEGSMDGYYLMQKEEGNTVKVTIPKFLLKSHLLN